MFVPHKYSLSSADVAQCCVPTLGPTDGPPFRGAVGPEGEQSVELRGEVRIEGGPGDPRHAGDVVDRGVAVPPGQEHRLGGVEDEVDGAPGPGPQLGRGPAKGRRDVDVGGRGWFLHRAPCQRWSGSRGSPRRRSAITLRTISDVPPAIVRHLVNR